MLFRSPQNPKTPWKCNIEILYITKNIFQISWLFKVSSRSGLAKKTTNAKQRRKKERKNGSKHGHRYDKIEKDVIKLKEALLVLKFDGVSLKRLHELFRLPGLNRGRLEIGLTGSTCPKRRSQGTL